MRVPQKGGCAFGEGDGKYRPGTYALKFSEKSFKNTLKFFSGIVDIVSVRTKTLSARRVGDISGGRRPILGGQAAETTN